MASETCIKYGSVIRESFIKARHLHQSAIANLNCSSFLKKVRSLPKHCSDVKPYTAAKDAMDCGDIDITGTRSLHDPGQFVFALISFRLTVCSANTRYTSSRDCIETRTDSADVIHPLFAQSAVNKELTPYMS